MTEFNIYDEFGNYIRLKEHQVIPFINENLLLYNEDMTSLYNILKEMFKTDEAETVATCILFDKKLKYELFVQPLGNGEINFQFLERTWTEDKNTSEQKVIFDKTISAEQVKQLKYFLTYK